MSDWCNPCDGITRSNPDDPQSKLSSPLYVTRIEYDWDAFLSNVCADERERSIVCHIRDFFLKFGLPFEPDFLYRMCKDKKFNVRAGLAPPDPMQHDPSATAKIERYILWRSFRSYVPEDLLAREFAGSHLQLLRCPDNVPLLLVHAARHSTILPSVDSYENFFAELMEYITSLASHTVFPIFRILVDLSATRQPTNPFHRDLNRDKRTVEIVNKFYPGCLHRICFVGAPSYVAVAIKAITPRTWRGRVMLVNNVEDAVARGMLRRADIPTFLGQPIDDVNTPAATPHDTPEVWLRRLLAARRPEGLASHPPPRRGFTVEDCVLGIGPLQQPFQPHLEFPEWEGDINGDGGDGSGTDASGDGWSGLVAA